MSFKAPTGDFNCDIMSLREFLSSLCLLSFYSIWRRRKSLSLGTFFVLSFFHLLEVCSDFNPICMARQRATTCDFPTTTFTLSLLPFSVNGKQFLCPFSRLPNELKTNWIGKLKCAHERAQLQSIFPQDLICLSLPLREIWLILINQKTTTQLSRYNWTVRHKLLETIAEAWPIDELSGDKIYLIKSFCKCLFITRQSRCLLIAITNSVDFAIFPAACQKKKSQRELSAAQMVNIAISLPSKYE